MVIDVLTLVVGTVSAICCVIQVIMQISDRKRKNNIYPYLH